MKRKQGLNTDRETTNVSLLSQQILDMQKSIENVRKMRDTIKYQLGLLDVEYSGKDLPAFSVKGLE